MGGPQGPWGAENCLGPRTCTAYSESLGGSDRPSEEVLGILGPRALRCAPKSRARVRKRPGSRRGAGCFALCAARPLLFWLLHCSACTTASEVLSWFSGRPGCFHLLLDWTKAVSYFALFSSLLPTSWADIESFWPGHPWQVSGGCWFSSVLSLKEDRCEAQSSTDKPGVKHCHPGVTAIVHGWKSSSWVKIWETVVLKETNLGVPIFPENITV